MRIRYYIYNSDWKETNAAEYYAWQGKKKTTSGLGLGWEIVTSMLLAYRK